MCFHVLICDKVRANMIRNSVYGKWTLWCSIQIWHAISQNFRHGCDIGVSHSFRPTSPTFSWGTCVSRSFFQKGFFVRFLCEEVRRKQTWKFWLLYVQPLHNNRRYTKTKTWASNTHTHKHDEQSLEPVVSQIKRMKSEHVHSNTMFRFLWPVEFAKPWLFFAITCHR